MRYRIIEIITSLCIFLFVYTAVSKLTDYGKFVAQIGQSPLLTSMASFVGWFIPSVELLIAALLLFPKTRLVGFYGFFGLMVLFTGYIIMVSRYSDYVPCSCGGVLQELSWNQHLVFNAVFVFATTVAILLSSSPFIQRVKTRTVMEQKNIE